MRARGGTLYAISAGDPVRALLAAERAGAVIARFAHSLYVRLGERGFVCVGAESIGAGPLNLLLGAADWARLHAAAPGCPARASRGALRCGDARIGLAGAVGWRARRPLPRHDAIGIELAALAACAGAVLPGCGLARLAFPAGPRRGPDALLDAARPGWDALGRWLERALGEHAAAGEPDAAVGALLGLGPGLTPSGDDVLAGALIALRLLGEERAADALWSWLAPALERRTSALSAAHLEAAARGEGHEALHAVLERLLEGAPEAGGGADGPGARVAERVQAAPVAGFAALLERLGRVGHCSGWDALAGASLACRAYAARWEAASRTASSAACAFDGATTTPERSRVRHCSE